MSVQGERTSRELSEGNQMAYFMGVVMGFVSCFLPRHGDGSLKAISAAW